MEKQDIYKYLNPISNDILTTMSNSDRVNIMLSLRKYFLELRNTLGINSNITFGTEIEFENSKRKMIEETISKNFPYNSWKVVDDRSIIPWRRNQFTSTSRYRENMAGFKDHM